MSTIELDLENLATEFPDECLIYMSNKMEIGLDDEKREKEYECFRVSWRNFINFISILYVSLSFKYNLAMCHDFEQNGTGSFTNS